jgi:hypothetical protein
MDFSEFLVGDATGGLDELWEVGSLFEKKEMLKN